jgi:nitroreductase
MELQNVLQQRRSIRKYKQQPVEKEKIEEMIQAAIYSESWKNSQTPRYHVIQSKEMLVQFKKKCLPEFNQKNIADAPVLIVTTLSP